MRHRNHLLALGLVTLVGGASSMVACGDDDPAGTPDSGTTQPSTTTPIPTTPPTDAAVPEDAPADAAPAVPVTTESQNAVPGALNPYGLVWGSDGNLYMSGATMVGGERQLAVWRFDKATNKVDTTFGTNGVVTVAIDGDETSYGIVELKDGSFVVQAAAAGKVWLAKLTKSGTTYTFGTPTAITFGWQDSEFGEWPVVNDAGVRATPQYQSWGIALDSSNAAAEKIVVFAFGAPAKVAGGGTQRTDNDRWIARVLASDFSHDPAFNGGKPVTFDADAKGLADNGRRGIVEADGTIVSAGYTDFGTGPSINVVLAKVKNDGTFDNAFGFGTASATASPGQTKFNPFQAQSGASEAYQVVKQSGGRYVTTGYGKSNFDTATQENDLLTFGLNRDGLDPTFGRLGSWAVQSEGVAGAGTGTRPFRENGRDLVVLPDDRTVHVGCWDDKAAVFLFGKNGQLDKGSFDGKGYAVFPTHGFPFFKAAVSPDGKRIAASAQSTSTDPASFVVTLKVGN